MLESYCGNSCELCPRREDSGCPGCRELTARERCSIAECCRSFGYDDCSACAFSSSCGKLDDRSDRKARRVVRAPAVGVDERVLANAAQTAKRLRLLFWLNIANLVISFISNQDKSGTLLWLRVAMIVLSMGVTIAYGITLLRLSGMSRQYRTAGILCFVSIAVVLIVFIVAQINPWNTSYYVLPLLVGIAADVLMAIFEYNGHEELLSTVDARLSHRWRLLWIWNLVLVFVALSSIILIFILMFLGLAAALFSALGILVVTIISLVSLWQTGQAVQSLVPPEIEGA